METKLDGTPFTVTLTAKLPRFRGRTVSGSSVGFGFALILTVFVVVCLVEPPPSNSAYSCPQTNFQTYFP
jgi:hypothetical protein